MRVIISLVTNYYIKLQGSIQITLSNTNAPFGMFRDVSFFEAGCKLSERGCGCICVDSRAWVRCPHVGIISMGVLTCTSLQTWTSYPNLEHGENKRWFNSEGRPVRLKVRVVCEVLVSGTVYEHRCTGSRTASHSWKNWPRFPQMYTVWDVSVSRRTYLLL